jgi:hypothetical protein
MLPALFCSAWQACHSSPFEVWHAYNKSRWRPVGSMFAGSFPPPSLPPARELRRGQIALRVVKFRRNELAGGPHTPPTGPPVRETSITCVGAPVANLIQVNVGTPRSANMVAAEDAQDVVFSGSIEKISRP